MVRSAPIRCSCHVGRRPCGGQNAAGVLQPRLSQHQQSSAGLCCVLQGIEQAAFNLLFAFDEVISLGYKENVTVMQVKQVGGESSVPPECLLTKLHASHSAICNADALVRGVVQNTEMDSHEEKLHKMIIQSKVNDTKDIMKRKAMEIDKSKVRSQR
jgi:coatomer subunit delta